MGTLLFLGLMVIGTFFLGCGDVLKRKYLRDGMDEQALVGISFLLGSVVLAVPLYWFGVPEVKNGFWSAVFVTGFLNVIGQNAFARSLKTTDASLVGPLRLLTPPLVVVTGFLILGEVPSLTGIGGILLTVTGLWFLFQGEYGVNARTLFARIWNDRGVLWAVSGSLLFALSFPFDKKAVVLSSALFMATVAFFIIGTCTILLNLWFSGSFRKEFWPHLRTYRFSFLLVALLDAGGAWLTLHALNFSLAAYAASAKRLWSFWTVILAGAFLKERNVRMRLAAALLMFLGILLTAIFG